ncbi:hypothetical protein PAEPH01_2481 [Pancytospora epiphaga]|nr:hypothetical protein PAEPH01_2481 [Pancytospora epiphaga]
MDGEQVDVTEDVVIFRRNESNAKSIEDLSVENPGYVKIYLNINKNDNKTVLSLSKGKGDILYILSNRDFPNYRSYLTAGIMNGRTSSYEQKGVFTASQAQKSKLTVPSGSIVKKAKQQSLFNYFNKA